MMDSPAVCRDTFELLLVLGGWPDASDRVSKDSLGSAEYEPADGLADGSWLSHLQLNLQVGSRFHVQSGGRATLGSWDQHNTCWITDELQLQLQDTHLCPRVVHPAYMLLSLSDTQRPSNTSSPSTATAATAITPNCTAIAMKGQAKLMLNIQHSSNSNNSGCKPVDVSVQCSGHYLPITRKAVPEIASPSFVSTVQNSYASGQYSLRMENPGFSADAEREEDQMPCTVSIPGGLPSSGMLVVECKQQDIICSTLLVLITSDDLLAQELGELLLVKLKSETRTPGNLLFDIGSWLDYVFAVLEPSAAPETSSLSASPPAASAATSLEACNEAPTPHSTCLSPPLSISPMISMHRPEQSHFRSYSCRIRMSHIGIHLVEYALDTGCPHLASCMLRDMLALGHTARWVVQQSESKSGGTTFLHRAVASGCFASVDLVVQWGKAHGTPCSWEASANFPAGSHHGSVTPLQAAELLADGGVLLQRILFQYPTAASLWEVAANDCGASAQRCASIRQHSNSRETVHCPSAAPAAASVSATGNASAATAIAAVTSTPINSATVTGFETSGTSSGLTNASATIAALAVAGLSQTSCEYDYSDCARVQSLRTPPVGLSNATLSPFSPSSPGAVVVTTIAALDLLTLVLDPLPPLPCIRHHNPQLALK